MRSGYGTSNIFKLVWNNSNQSRSALGYPEMVRQLEKRITTCHTSNFDAVKKQLELAKEENGLTVFDW